MKNMVKKLSVLLNNIGLDRGMKNRLYNILEVDNNNESKLDELYSYFMILMIVMSIIPLFTRERNILLYLMEDISLIVFLIDYLLRWYCADIRIKRGWKSYFIYPFTFLHSLIFYLLFQHLQLLIVDLRH